MDSNQTVIVTGGAGFIGSNFVLQWLSQVGTPLVNFDALTYAGNAENLDSLATDQRHTFVRKRSSILPPKATSIDPLLIPAPSSALMCRGH
jgi:nucleoside-diphosphate-sugar epimerase